MLTRSTFGEHKMLIPITFGTCRMLILGSIRPDSRMRFSLSEQAGIDHSAPHRSADTACPGSLQKSAPKETLLQFPS